MELLHSFFYGYFNLYLNLGLWCGMVMGILLLLRPVLCRLLTPGQRVFLWGVAWVGGLRLSCFRSWPGLSCRCPPCAACSFPGRRRAILCSCL